ncbi:MAG: beta-ketoacyl-ACP synthase III [Candidatus Saelkia tenebricola]|nr:beta-ketoacyl-ACP synthase III [Candidatus Saelkia tenebricola]
MDTGVIGWGFYVPDEVRTNKDLEKIVDTSDEWITTRTGIKERRIAPPEMAVSDMGVKAAKKALKKAGLTPFDIDLIIVATITPDMFFPSTACFVQAKLKARNIACFDVSAACSGFIYALKVAKGLIESGSYRNALVIGAEKLTAITDWQDRNTCVLFGDGAGAVVLGPVKKGGIKSVYLGADGSKSELLNMPGGGSRNPATHETVNQGMHYVKMKGNELFKFAVRLMAESAYKALRKAGLDKTDIKYLIPHQANSRIIWATARKLDLEKKQIFVNIHKYGNMSSASCAVALCESLSSKGVKKGDNLLLVAFGGGLTWGASVIEVS